MSRREIAIAVAMLASAIVVGCGDPCEGVTCDHGACSDETGACECDDGWSGDSCDSFDCASLACGDHGSCDDASGACACDDEWSGALCDTQDALEIAGSWVDNYAGSHEITQSTWVMDMGGTFHISQYSNGDDFLIAQNDAANAYNPDLWSRFDWTYDGSDLYYCQSAYDAASEAAALAATPANASDLNSGCGGFAWSALTAQ